MKEQVANKLDEVVESTHEVSNEALREWRSDQQAVYDQGRRPDDLNLVVLTGSLVDDPTSRELDNGAVVARFRLGAWDRFTRTDGEPGRSVCFIEVNVWGRQAEICRKFLRKGSRVLITGAIQLSQWQTEEGENRSRIRLRARRVQFLPKIPRPRNAPDAGDAASKAAAPENKPEPLPV